MIRVLHIFAALDMGGAETMIMNVYRNIDKSKIQFDFLCMSEKKGDYEDEINKLGGRIFRINPPKKVGYVKHIKEIVKVCKKYGFYKAIHIPTKFHSGVVCLAACIAKVPIRIVHSHTSSDADSTFIRKLYNFMCRRLINIFSTYKVACGEKAGEFLFGKKAMKNGDVIILNNGIETKKYMNIKESEVNNLKTKLKIDKNELIIGNVGRFVKVKNHEFFIKLAKNLKKLNIKFKIVLVGDGELKEEIEQKVAKENLQNCFIFMGKRNDIPLIMNMIDVFVLPSLYEGFPMVLIEAFASGKNCVISDTISKEIDMEQGFAKFISLNADMEEWISAIIEQSEKENDSNRRIKIICEKGFSIEKTTSKLSKIYLS